MPWVKTNSITAISPIVEGSVSPVTINHALRGAWTNNPFPVETKCVIRGPCAVPVSVPGTNYLWFGEGTTFLNSFSSGAGAPGLNRFAVTFGVPRSAGRRTGSNRPGASASS